MARKGKQKQQRSKKQTAAAAEPQAQEPLAIMAEDMTDGEPDYEGVSVGDEREGRLLDDADAIIRGELTEEEYEEHFGMPDPAQDAAEIAAMTEAGYDKLAGGWAGDHVCQEPAVGPDGEYTDETESAPAETEAVTGETVTPEDETQEWHQTNGPATDPEVAARSMNVILPDDVEPMDNQYAHERAAAEMVNVAIYLNRATDAEGRSLGFLGYQSTHPMEHVYDLNVPDGSDIDICEKAFEILNIAHPEDYKQRSLSVGDVVVFSGRAFKCESVGWEPLENFNPEGTPEPPPEPEPEPVAAKEPFESFHTKYSAHTAQGTPFHIPQKRFSSLSSAQCYSTPTGGPNAIVNYETKEYWLNMPTDDGPWEWQQVPEPVFMTALKAAKEQWEAELAKFQASQAPKQLPASTPEPKKRGRKAKSEPKPAAEAKPDTPVTIVPKSSTRAARRDVHEWVAAKVVAAMTKGNYEVAVVSGAQTETEIRFTAPEGEALFLQIVSGIEKMAAGKGRQEARDYKLGAAYRLLADTQSADYSTPQTDGLTITAGKYKWTVRGASNPDAYRAGYNASPVVDIDPATCSVMPAATINAVSSVSASPAPPVATGAF